MPIRVNEITDLTPERARSGLGYTTAFLATVALGLVLWGGFNWAVNARALYRNHSGLTNLGYQRAIKVDLLRAADPPPQILVLGSSRVRHLDPRQVKRLSNGKECFSAGVAACTVQDLLAFTRYAIGDLGHPIGTIIIGMDPESLVRDPYTFNTPANVTELRRNLDSPFLDWLFTRKHLISPRLTNDSFEAVMKTLTRKQRYAGHVIDLGWRDYWNDFKNTVSLMVHSPSPRIGGIGEDGYNPPPERKRKPAPLKVSPDLPPYFIERDHLLPKNVREFESLVEYCQDRGVILVLYLSPFPPWMTDQLQHTHFARIQEETLEVLRKAEESGAIYCEVSHLRLNWEEFDRYGHPDAPSQVRIVREVMRNLAERGGF